MKHTPSNRSTWWISYALFNDAVSWYGYRVGGSYTNDYTALVEWPISLQPQLESATFRKQPTSAHTPVTQELVETRDTVAVLTSQTHACNKHVACYTSQFYKYSEPTGSDSDSFLIKCPYITAVLHEDEVWPSTETSHDSNIPQTMDSSQSSGVGHS